ncbi:histidine phosphatase family protein [Thalassobacillus pellis]|uniref:histidine phosphatase family protein n=1 Tax=Thalassobacillus pellis TaxID=748008 RepID=UPI001961ED09|nr:histidine phosphatase family protein [Thalassobacillus pellis]MBM7552549.1 2,3-bisphosphoglycerate-dependent phosphoglycerate mutase [Thalassobacillus pellis]
MKKLFLIRHSATEGQHQDSPLTKLGVRQSQAISVFLDKGSYPIDRVISSPYLRAIETIKPYAESRGLTIEIDDRLKERILSKEPLDDFLEYLEDTFKDLDFKMPGGESSNEAKTRVSELVAELEQDENNDTICLVTHGNLLALLLQTFGVEADFDQWKNITNPDVYLVEKHAGKYVVQRIWRD